MEEEPFSEPEFYQQLPEDALVQEGDPIPLVPLAAAALPSDEAQQAQPMAADIDLPAAAQASAGGAVTDPRPRYQTEYAAMAEWLRRGQSPPLWALPPKEPGEWSGPVIYYGW